MIWPKVYEVPIREAPVLTLCFSSTGDGKYSADKTIYNFSTDFNMTVQEFNMLTESKAKITLKKRGKCHGKEFFKAYILSGRIAHKI